MRKLTLTAIVAIAALAGCQTTTQPPVRVEPLTTAQWTAIGSGICRLRGYELTKGLVVANVPEVTNVSLWDDRLGAVITVNGNDQMNFWGLVDGRVTAASGYNYAGADRNCH